MRLFTYIIILFCITSVSLAQKTVGGVAASGLDMNTAIGGFISEIDRTNYEPIGNVYISDEWSEASVMLRNDKLINGLDIRVNLLKNAIDIKDKKIVRTFTVQKIRYMDIKVLSDSSTRYYNPFNFRFNDNTPVVGLIRKITDKTDSWNVVERTYLKIYEATYVKALDAGTKQDRYEVQKDRYLVKDNILYPILPNKKKLANSLNLTNNKRDELLGFIKENKINLKEYASSYKLMSFLNK